MAEALIVDGDLSSESARRSSELGFHRVEGEAEPDLRRALGFGLPGPFFPALLPLPLRPLAAGTAGGSDSANRMLFRCAPGRRPARAA